MNKMINKPETDLRQPGFTYIACGSLTENNEPNKNFMFSKTS